ncbi:MAG: PHP domain-containing protein [Cellulosilyticum sp.]|nr:PHP domain-containing protein [Cellulosilyticum sp.]
MKLIDLHVHSTASDGTLTPSELAVYAHTKGLSAIALTDHDTISGIEECMQKGHEIGLTVIPGIEFSADHYGKEVHILGYYINPKDETLSAQLEDLIVARSKRNEMVLQKLSEVGCPLELEDLISAAGKDAVITRAHIAKALLNKGYIKERSEAFSKYIGEGKPCFVPKARFTTNQCIKLIHQAGGVAVLAHPMLYGYNRSEITQLIKGMKAAGLDGVECLYSTHTKEDTHHLLQVCSHLNLLPTGGSDFHGTNKPNLDLGCGYGQLAIPFKLLASIQQHLGLSLR